MKWTPQVQVPSVHHDNIVFNWQHFLIKLHSLSPNDHSNQPFTALQSPQFSPKKSERSDNFDPEALIQIFPAAQGPE